MVQAYLARDQIETAVFEPARNRIPRGLAYLSRLPFDRAAHGGELWRGRRAGRGDRAHGFDEFPARARGRRIGAALVKPAAIFELAARVVAEEIRRGKPLRALSRGY